MTPLIFKRLHPDARMPTYATTGSACFDIAALNDADCYPDVPAVIRTGLAFQIPPGHVMLVFSRSGHGFNHGVRLANCVGVIDSDYRGELMVKLTSDDGRALTVKAGDRIAQAMILPLPTVVLMGSDALDETGRGMGGLGSTGR